jgi:hypothetical protein
MQRFWNWYERHYTLNVSIAAALFALQILHLVWLTAEPLWTKLFDEALFTIDKPYSWPLYLVDYTEIPALLGVSLLYLHELRSGLALRPVLFLVFLNTQWLHIFWITDEFVVDSSGAQGTVLPAWLAYAAILIDYLELPVIADTVRKTVAAHRERRLGVLLTGRLAPRLAAARDDGPSSGQDAAQEQRKKQHSRPGQ